MCQGQQNVDIIAAIWMVYMSRAREIYDMSMYSMVLDGYVPGCARVLLGDMDMQTASERV